MWIAVLAIAQCAPTLAFGTSRSFSWRIKSMAPMAILTMEDHVKSLMTACKTSITLYEYFSVN